MKQMALVLVSLCALAACESGSPVQVERAASAPVAVPAALRSSTLEAQEFCLPRECGRIPVCTDDSVARCSPETGCHWACVPINGPL
jgi:hypothetical protein